MRHRGSGRLAQALATIVMRLRTSLFVLLQVVVGAGIGILVLYVAHRFSVLLSRGALSRHMLEPLASWWQTRLLSWALVSLVAGLVIGLTFRRRAVLPALVAAVVPPIFYVVTFVDLMPHDGLRLVQPYAFEALVLLSFLPTSAYFVGRGRGG